MAAVGEPIKGCAGQTFASQSSGAELAPMTPDDDYLKVAGEHARRRIVAAGVRLGVLLKDVAGELAANE